MIFVCVCRWAFFSDNQGIVVYQILLSTAHSYSAMMSVTPIVLLFFTVDATRIGRSEEEQAWECAKQLTCKCEDYLARHARTCGMYVYWAYVVGSACHSYRCTNETVTTYPNAACMTVAPDQKPGSTHGLSCPLSPLTPRPLPLSPQRNLNMTACTSEEGKGAAWCCM